MFFQVAILDFVLIQLSFKLAAFALLLLKLPIFARRKLLDMMKLFCRQGLYDSLFGVQAKATLGLQLR